MRVTSGCTDRYVIACLVVYRLCLFHVLHVMEEITGAVESPAGKSQDRLSFFSYSSLQNEAPLFSQDGHKFFFTRAIPQGGRGKFFHISMSTSMVIEGKMFLMM